MAEWQWRADENDKWHTLPEKFLDDAKADGREIRALYDHHRSVGVPGGWKLVPVEPTEAMYEAADAALKAATVKITIGPAVGSTLVREPNRVIYKAMIAASPSAGGV